MSRAYGIIESALWQNGRMRALSDTELLTFVYLVTSPHANSVGCYVLPAGYITADRPQWSPETVSQTLLALSGKGFIERDEASGLTRITGWFGHNSPANGNVVKSMLKSIDALPDNQLKLSTLKALGDLDLEFVAAFRGGIDGRIGTLSKRLAKPSRNGMANQNLPEPNLPEPNHAAAKAAPIESKKSSPSPNSSTGAHSKPKLPPKLGRRIEGGFEATDGEFVSFEEAYWALADVAAEKGIARSQVVKLLSVHDRKAGAAYDALALAFRKDVPATYVAKVIHNRETETKHARAAADGLGVAIPGDPAEVPSWVLLRRAAGEIVTWTPKKKYWEAGGRGYDNNECEVAG